jgi:hypothetical protein
MGSNLRIDCYVQERDYRGISKRYSRAFGDVFQLKTHFHSFHDRQRNVLVTRGPEHGRGRSEYHIEGDLTRCDGLQLESGCRSLPRSVSVGIELILSNGDPVVFVLDETP